MRVALSTLVFALLLVVSHFVAANAADLCAPLAGKTGRLIYPSIQATNYINTTWELINVFCQSLQVRPIFRSTLDRACF